MNPGWIMLIGSFIGGFFGIAVAGRHDNAAFGFGIATGVAYAWCFIDGSPVWAAPATVLLIVTVLIGRSRRSRSPKRSRNGAS